MNQNKKGKLAVLGGGGVRSPYLAKSIALAAGELGIRETVFQDINEKKLFTYGRIAENTANAIAPELSFRLSTDAEDALSGADYVITTIRADGDEGRVIDERTALKHGVLGQETTGAGGFAMALRSIPVLAEYCELAKRVSASDVAVFNFTNPSGLVTQALRSRGYDFVYGVCDAPSGFMRQIKGLLLSKGLFPSKDVLTAKGGSAAKGSFAAGQFRADCFGLNHLSWFRNFSVGGKDVTKEVLSDPRLFQDTELRIFTPEVLNVTGGTLPNEYLYFYYYREKALEAIQSAGRTRGETIRDINLDMDKELDGMDLEREFDRAFECYMRHYAMREDSYFSIESGKRRERKWAVPDFKEFIRQPDSGGYAGVALDCIRALEGGEPAEMVLSVPNGGVLPMLAPSDVAELSCTVDRDGVHVREVGEVPELPALLIRTVKKYENLTAEAVFEKSFPKAVQALSVHPLVNSYSLAESLAREYGKYYRGYIGEWSDEYGEA